jgi:hypothetical protein
MFRKISKIKFEFKKDGIKYYSLKSDILFQYKDRDIYVRKIWHGETFYTNLMSIPKIFHRWLKPNYRKYILPSALHDFLYSQRDTNRFWCDWIFLCALKDQKVNFIGRWFYFIIVVLCGWRNKAK